MYDGPREPYAPQPNDGKIRTRNWFQRHQPFVIAIIVLLVLLVAAISTIAILLNRPTPSVAVSTPTPTATTAQDTPIPISTPEPQFTPTEQILTPTQAVSTPSADTTLSPSTKNYQFVCLTGCSDDLTVILNSINLGPGDQTMTWNLTITNNGGLCQSLDGNVSIETPNGQTISKDGGSLGDRVAINTGQSLPKTATFSSVPRKGTVNTVTFSAFCNDSPTYQPVLFSY